jgi:hypothetical protein
VLTNRTDFNETWLAEMPARLGDFGETFEILEKTINSWIQDGHKPTALGNELYKLSGKNMIYYWYQSGQDIAVAVELQRRPQGFMVDVVGKNPKYKNSAPYATDLYQAVLSDVPGSLLFSDGQLSDDGISLWKRLMSDGTTTVSVYNTKDPGKTFVTLTDPSQLDDYMSAGHYHDRLVLSKRGLSLAETRSYFNTRRYRELAGIMLEDEEIND